MSRSTSRKSGIGTGRRIRSALLLAQEAILENVFRHEAAPSARTGAVGFAGRFAAWFFMLTLLMLSVVAIDVISTLLLLCRKLLGRGQSEGRAFMPRG